MTRARTPDELLTPARAAKFAIQALAHAPAAAVVDTVIREVCDNAQDWRERQAARWGSAWSRWPAAAPK
jgi:hypothetical protein